MVCGSLASRSRIPNLENEVNQILVHVLYFYMFVCVDVRKQQQMAQLTKERDHLFETIRTYRSLFDTTRQLIQEMRGECLYQDTPD